MRVMGMVEPNGGGRLESSQVPGSDRPFGAVSSSGLEEPFVVPRPSKPAPGSRRLRCKVPVRRTPALYPVMLDLGGRRCLVIGGGVVALRKAEALLLCGASVRAVAPDWADGFVHLKGRRLRRITRAFRPRDLDGCALAIAATDDPSVQRKVARAAAARGIFCNVVDEPGLCSFQAPAILRRGSLTVAVSTAGESPLFAARLRDHLAWLLGPRIEWELRRVARARRLIRERHALDPARRREESLRLLPPGAMAALIASGAIPFRRPLRRRGASP